jgi:hypothetical protein
MDDMNSWSGKDDDELTADDLAQMMDAGEPVEIVGPRTLWEFTRPANTQGPGLTVPPPVVYAHGFTTLQSV